MTIGFESLGFPCVCAPTLLPKNLLPTFVIIYTTDLLPFFYGIDPTVICLVLWPLKATLFWLLSEYLMREIARLRSCSYIIYDTTAISAFDGVLSSFSPDISSSRTHILTFPLRALLVRNPSSCLFELRLMYVVIRCWPWLNKTLSYWIGILFSFLRRAHISWQKATSVCAEKLSVGGIKQVEDIDQLLNSYLNHSCHWPLGHSAMQFLRLTGILLSM